MKCLLREREAAKGLKPSGFSLSRAHVGILALRAHEISCVK
jgi:hypothetical protein